MTTPRPRRTVMMCHDCCCGTPTKHPGFDSAAQRDALRACADDEIRVRTVECLDECRRSNVVVVREHACGAARGKRDTWLGDVLSVEATEALTTWISQGGPLPAQLQPFVFAQTRPGHASD